MRDRPCKTTLEKTTGQTKGRTNGGPDDDKNIRGKKEKSRGSAPKSVAMGEDLRSLNFFFPFFPLTPKIRGDQSTIVLSITLHHT